MSLVYIWPFRQTRGKIRADFLTDESKTCVDEPLPASVLLALEPRQRGVVTKVP